MKVFVLKGILGGLHGRSHGSRREVMVFLTESTAFCRRMKTYPWEVIRDAAQRGLILLGKNLANNGRFFNNMTSLYDGSYAAFKIRFQWLFLSSVLVLILSVIPIVLYIFLMKGICPPFLPFSHFPEIPPLFSFFELVIWEFASNSSQEPASISTSRFSSFSHSRRWGFVSFLFHRHGRSPFPLPILCALWEFPPLLGWVSARGLPQTLLHPGPTLDVITRSFISSLAWESSKIWPVPFSTASWVYDTFQRVFEKSIIKPVKWQFIVSCFKKGMKCQWQLKPPHKNSLDKGLPFLHTCYHTLTGIPPTLLRAHLWGTSHFSLPVLLNSVSKCVHNWESYE